MSLTEKKKITVRGHLFKPHAPWLLSWVPIILLYFPVECSSSPDLLRVGREMGIKEGMILENVGASKDIREPSQVVSESLSNPKFYGGVSKSGRPKS